MEKIVTDWKGSNLLAEKKLGENNLHWGAAHDTFGVLVNPRFGEWGEYEIIDLAAENMPIVRKRERKALLV